MQQALGFSLLVTLVMIACTPDPQEDPYFPKVKEIIQKNCTICHAPGRQGAPVVLVTDEDITKRFATIKATTIDEVSSLNKRMPQGGELTKEEKEIIEKWFNKGGRATD